MKKYTYYILFCLLYLFLFPNNAPASTSSLFHIDSPHVVLNGISFDIDIQLRPAFYVKFKNQTLPYRIVNSENGRILATDSIHIDPRHPLPISIKNLKINEGGQVPLAIHIGPEQQTISVRSLPAILSILPPLLAILLALVTRQVIVALFFGVWLGVTFIYHYNPFTGFLHTLDEYIINALVSPDRISILIFSLVLGGMVGVMTRSGGTQGIVEKLSTYARNPRLGQLATWAMGVVIFFDDYANTLIVGNTMRPLTDKLHISREKLSYLVDSTAAPVANVAIISTWIGYEISLIDQSFSTLGVTDNPYITFIRTIPYNFYPLYALIFGLLVAVLLRDFGSMFHAEKRSRTTGRVLREGAVPVSDVASRDMVADPSTPRRWYNALIPVAVVILAVIAGLVYSGYRNVGQNTIAGEEGFVPLLSLIVGNADSFAVLMWASFLGSITAILLALGQRLLNLQEALEAWVKGIRSMVMAAIILISAWTIGTICQDLFTADYVIHLTREFITPHWLPLITFFTAATVSFATGTSWGTMAILMPIAIPLAFKFPQAYQAIDATHATMLMLSTTASVLAGATFGDHCSPISDTTIMSSMASGADHIDHVRTQLPYALTVGVVASLFGYIPVGFDIGGWWVLGIGCVVLFLIVRFVGKKPD